MNDGRTNQLSDRAAFNSRQPLDLHQHNRIAWNRLARAKNRFARPARDEDFVNLKELVHQTGWLGGDITGKRVLCLAAGGGRHGPIYATAGGVVTVVDISDAMLELDREVARLRKLSIRTLQASMDDLSQLGDATFDIVIQPVSTCYIPDVRPMYCEVARVLSSGGVYISQHKQPTSLQASITAGSRGYVFEHAYDRKKPLPDSKSANRIREPGTHEYVHTWQQLLGEMCRAGFVIQDVQEPDHGDPTKPTGSFGHRSRFIAPYIRIKAERMEVRAGRPALWTP